MFDIGLVIVLLLALFLIACILVLLFQHRNYNTIKHKKQTGIEAFSVLNSTGKMMDCTNMHNHITRSAPECGLQLPQMTMDKFCLNDVCLTSSDLKNFIKLSSHLPQILKNLSSNIQQQSSECNDVNDRLDALEEGVSSISEKGSVSSVSKNKSQLNPPLADGGDKTFEHEGYNVHVFLQSGELRIKTPGAVDVLVVGGGGGAGTFGGGGAGRVVYKKGYEVDVGSVEVTVGSGGVGAGNWGPGSRIRWGRTRKYGVGKRGKDSSFGDIFATGGGGGGAHSGNRNTDNKLLLYGQDGGSGGGAGGGGSNNGGKAVGEEGKGNDGGDSPETFRGHTFEYNLAGGGGGAGGKGENGGNEKDKAGDGGKGVDFSDEFGTSFGDDGWFGGGGGGGADDKNYRIYRDGTTALPRHIIPNRAAGKGGKGGGGDGDVSNRDGPIKSKLPKENSGGGGGGQGHNRSVGQDGAKGIVLVRYPIVERSHQSTQSSNVSIDEDEDDPSTASTIDQLPNNPDHSGNGALDSFQTSDKNKRIFAGYGCRLLNGNYSGPQAQITTNESDELFIYFNQMGQQIRVLDKNGKDHNTEESNFEIKKLFNQFDEKGTPSLNFSNNIIYGSAVAVKGYDWMTNSDLDSGRQSYNAKLDIGALFDRHNIDFTIGADQIDGNPKNDQGSLYHSRYAAIGIIGGEMDSKRDKELYDQIVAQRRKISSVILRRNRLERLVGDGRASHIFDTADATSGNLNNRLGNDTLVYAYQNVRMTGFQRTFIFKHLIIGGPESPMKEFLDHLRTYD